MGTVVLVEGLSDKLAVETLARRLGLSMDGVEIVAMGGATNVGAFAARYGSSARVLGLCDAGEERLFARAGLEFFVCVEDLEDELIRALGPEGAESALERLGWLGSFRTFQKQPQWRGRSLDAQVRRFIGAHAGLKERAAVALAEALDPARVPEPLAALLARLSP